MTPEEGEKLIDRVFKIMYALDNELLGAVSIINDLYEVGLKTKIGKTKYQSYLDEPLTQEDDDDD
jgi:hypothetical protein